MATTNDSCMETVIVDGKPKKRRRKGCGSVTKFGKRSVPPAVKKIGAAAALLGAGAIAYGKNAFGLKDKLSGQKKGGTVKKMAKGGFPDLTGDGKVTKADVLKGRGVIKRKGGSTKK